MHSQIENDGSVSADITADPFNPPKKSLIAKLQLFNQRGSRLVYTPLIKKEAAPFIPEILDELKVEGYKMERGKGLYLVSPRDKIRVAMNTGNWWHLLGDGTYFTLIALWQRKKGLPDGDEGYETAALELQAYVKTLKDGEAENVRLQISQKERHHSFASKDSFFDILFEDKKERGHTLYLDAPGYTHLINERCGLLDTPEAVSSDTVLRQLKAWAASQCPHRFVVEMKPLAQRRYKFRLISTGRDVRAEMKAQYDAVMLTAPEGKYDEWAKGWVGWTYR